MDSLSNAAQKRIGARIAKTLSAYLKTLSGTDMPPSKERLEESYFPEVDPNLVRDTETLIATALLLGMDHASRKLNAADEEIPPLPFEEAVSFMKSRVPMTKAEWNKLEPKLRFRTFTVARLAQCDYIEAARGRLISAMKDGQGFASTWNDIKAIADEDGALNLKPGYWENVFRTNTQTAYTAGKLMQFRDNPPPAWRLLVIDDSRTSDICRGLLREGKRDIAMPSDHPFWKEFGFPSYHYQCRTGLQAVYQSQIGTDVQVENPSMKSLRKNFKPMKGFGGNPLEKESFFKLTDKMLARAARYGIIPDLDNFAISLGFTDVFLMRNINWQDGFESLKVGEHEIYIAKNRIKLGNQNLREKEKLETEIQLASMLPSQGFKEVYVILDSWNGIAYGDTFADGCFIELKNLSGNIKTIGREFRDALGQSKNVFLKINSDYSIERVKNKLHGEVLDILNTPASKKDLTGFVLCYFSKLSKWTRWNVLSLK